MRTQTAEIKMNFRWFQKKRVKPTLSVVVETDDTHIAELFVGIFGFYIQRELDFFFFRGLENMLRIADNFTGVQ